MLGWPGRGSDIIGNDDKVPVQLRFDDAESTVVAQTMEGHMLEGQRSWSVDVKRSKDIPGFENRKQSGFCTAKVWTVSIDRQVGIVNDLGALGAGVEKQMEIWDQYLMNIQKEYGGTHPSLKHSKHSTGQTSLNSGWW